MLSVGIGEDDGTEKSGPALCVKVLSGMINSFSFVLAQTSHDLPTSSIVIDSPGV